MSGICDNKFKYFKLCESYKYMVNVIVLCF